MHLAALTERRPAVRATRAPPQVRRAVSPAEPPPGPPLAAPADQPPAHLAAILHQHTGSGWVGGWEGGGGGEERGYGFTCQYPNSGALLLGHLEGGAPCASAPACSPPAACHEGAAAGGPCGGSDGWPGGPPGGAAPPSVPPAATWSDASPSACRALPQALSEASGGVRDTECAAAGGGPPHLFTCSASCHCCATVKPGG